MSTSAWTNLLRLSRCWTAKNGQERLLKAVQGSFTLAFRPRLWPLLECNPIVSTCCITCQPLSSHCARLSQEQWAAKQWLPTAAKPTWCLFLQPFWCLCSCSEHSILIYINYQIVNYTIQIITLYHRVRSLRNCPGRPLDIFILAVRFEPIHWTRSPLPPLTISRITQSNRLYLSPDSQHEPHFLLSLGVVPA